MMKIRDKEKGFNVIEEKIFDLFDDKIVSLRKYDVENNELLLALGKNKIEKEGFEKEEEIIDFFNIHG